LIDGTCEACPEFTRVTNTGRDCAPNKCNERERLLADGFCELCPPYFDTDPDDHKNCIDK